MKGLVCSADGTHVLGENPVPTPHCPPPTQIPHRIAWSSLQASELRSRR